jgi:hypothetical protein
VHTHETEPMQAPAEMIGLDTLPPMRLPGAPGWAYLLGSYRPMDAFDVRLRPTTIVLGVHHVLVEDSGLRTVCGRRVEPNAHRIWSTHASCGACGQRLVAEGWRCTCRGSPSTRSVSPTTQPSVSGWPRTTRR